MTRLKSKKADVVGDSVLILIFIFVFAFALILIYPAFSDLNADFQADPDMPANSKLVTSSILSRYPDIVDGIFIFVFVMLSIAVVVGAYFLDASPIFFIVAIIVYLVLLGAGAFMSNAMEDIMSDSDISHLVPIFPNTYWIVTHFPVIMLIDLCFIGIALYAKNRST